LDCHPGGGHHALFQMKTISNFSHSERKVRKAQGRRRHGCFLPFVSPNLSRQPEPGLSGLGKLILKLIGKKT
jgi:hypothetical protein